MTTPYHTAALPMLPPWCCGCQCFQQLALTQDSCRMLPACVRVPLLAWYSVSCCCLEMSAPVICLALPPSDDDVCHGSSGSLLLSLFWYYCKRPPQRVILLRAIEAAEWHT